MNDSLLLGIKCSRRVAINVREGGDKNTDAQECNYSDSLYTPERRATSVMVSQKGDSGGSDAMRWSLSNRNIGVSYQCEGGSDGLKTKFNKVSKLALRPSSFCVW